MSTVSVAEAGRRLGVSSRTIYRWVGEGLLPTVDAGRGTRIEEGVLEGFVPPTRSRTGATDGDVRGHVLDAARSVLAADGVAALTIERVAATAQMSVGGVTYHFPSKAAMVDGLVDTFVDAFEQAWAAARATGKSPADAYVTISLDGVGDGRNQRGMRAVLVAVADRPDTRRRVDRRIKQWYREIAETSSDPEADVQRCLAADALWLFDVLGIRPLPRRARPGSTKDRSS